MTPAPASPAALIVRGTPEYRRASLALFLGGFATFSLLYCVQPLLPEFAAEFGVSAAQSSLALSLSTGLLAFAILGAAMLAEGRGRRRLMAASIAAAAVFNILAALAPGWAALLALRALEGVALGGVPAVAMAYLAEEFDPRGLGRAMGLYIAGTAFGGMAGRVATGFLADALGWRGALVIVGLTGLASAAAFLALLPPSRHFAVRRGLRLADHLRAWGGHLKTPVLPLLFAIGFLAMGAFVALYNYAGFRLTAPPYGLSQSALGLIFTAYLLGMAGSAAAGAMADRWGLSLVLPGALLVAMAGVAVTLAEGLAPVIAGIAILTFGFFAAHSAASGWVGRAAKGDKGHASALYLLAYYLGSSLAGSAGGWFWDGLGWAGVAGFTLALLGMAILAALALRRT